MNSVASDSESPDPEFELDLEPTKEDRSASDPDDMEFDPLSGGSDSEGADVATEFELPRSIPPGVALPPPVRRPPRSETAVSELTLDFDDTALDEPSSEGGGSVQGWAVSPPSAPTPVHTTRGGSGSASSVVPDLEVPNPRPSRRRSIPPPTQRAAGPGLTSGGPTVGSAAVESQLPPSLDLDYGSRPTNDELVRAESGRSLSPPSKLSSISSRPAPKSRAVPAFDLGGHAFGMTGENEIGGLDDLDLTGGARSAQLDVAVALPKDDPEPWPLGRSPYDDELEQSPSTAREHGFGPAPGGLLGAPGYFLRVTMRRAAVHAQLQSARAELAEREAMRDERLAVLAEEKRSLIESQERFSPLFARVDELSAELETEGRNFEAFDQGVAAEMRDLERHIESCRTKRLQQESVRDVLRLELQEQERKVARLLASLKRLDIEERNLSARYQADGITDAQHHDLAGQLEDKRAQSTQELEHEERKKKQLLGRVLESENEVRVARAEQQGREGALEAHLIAIEGSSAERSDALLGLRKERAARLADIGRGIIELRGSVPVDVATRRELLSLEARVWEAASLARMRQLAVDEIDADAYGLGKVMWIALFSLLGLLLVYSIIG